MDAVLDAGPHRRWATRAGIALLAVQLAAMVVASDRHYASFSLSKDFSMYHQAWYLIAHGHLNPLLTTVGYPFWRDEFQLIMWPLSLLYWLYPHAVTLLWVQDLATVGAEAVALLWVMEEVVVVVAVGGAGHQAWAPWKTWALSGVTVTVLVANPFTYLAASQDFHVEALTGLFGLLCARALRRRRGLPALGWSAATLLTGALGGVLVIGLGLAAVAATAGRRRSAGRLVGVGLTLATAGVLWIAVIAVIHADRGSGLGNYTYLTGGRLPLKVGQPSLAAVVEGAVAHPDRVTRVLSARAGSLAQVIRPSGWIGLLSPWALLPSAVFLGVNALNTNPFFASPSFQTLPVFALEAAGSLLVGLAVWRRQQVIGVMVMLLLVANAITTAVADWPAAPYPITAGTASRLAAVERMATPDTEVVASFGVVGRFAGRRYIYVMNGPHQTVPLIQARTLFVFAPNAGNQFLPITEVDAARTVVAALPGGRPVVIGNGVDAYEVTRTAGITSVTLP